MRYLSKRDLEVLSRRVLSKYLSLCKETPTRIDPVDFAKRMLGLEFDYQALGTASDQVGITVFGNVELNIYYSNGEKVSLQTNENLAIVDSFLLKQETRAPCILR